MWSCYSWLNFYHHLDNSWPNKLLKRAMAIFFKNLINILSLMLNVLNFSIDFIIYWQLNCYWLGRKDCNLNFISLFDILNILFNTCYYYERFMCPYTHTRALYSVQSQILKKLRTKYFVVILKWYRALGESRGALYNLHNDSPNEKVVYHFYFTILVCYCFPIKMIFLIHLKNGHISMTIYFFIHYVYLS